LVLAVVAAMSLLTMTLADWMPLAIVISLLILATFAFGLIAPNAMQGAMQPLPQIAGAAGAATGCIQMATGAVVSGLVATLYDEHSALSMAALMAVCSLHWSHICCLPVPPSASSFCLEHKSTIAPRCMLAISGSALAFAQPIFHVCAFA
jgi:hypothetical protein